jgi:hypothetical protein
MSILKVHLPVIQAVLFHEDEDEAEKQHPFLFLHSERGFKLCKTWFSSRCRNLSVVPAAVWSETEFLQFMRLATNLGDVRILNLFDWLETGGYMEFDSFFLVLALLFSVECGQSTQFLFYHGRRFFDLCKKNPSDNTLSYNRFSRLAYAMGMTDDLIFGLLKQHGVVHFPPEIKFERYQLFYFAILKNFDKVARMPQAVRTEWEETYTSSASQCVLC